MVSQSIIKTIRPSQNFIFNKLVVMFLISTVLSVTAFSTPNRICVGANLHDSAYGMSSTQLGHFQKNLTENRNRGVAYKDRLDRVKAAVEHRNQNLKFPTGHDSKSIAQTIVWAAECTGNDFTILSSIQSVESGYCSDLTGGGADSGCSQLSVRKGASVAEMKSQLDITGGDKGAEPRVTTAAREMILSCLNNDESQLQSFLDFYARDYADIKSDLRNGRNVYFDILAGAIYLKFVTALAGGYIVPGDAPGGIARYNGGGVPNYLGKVEGAGQAEGRLYEIKESCIEDQFTPSVLEEACDVMGLQGDMCNRVNGISI